MNGEITYTQGTQYGSVVTFTCRAGYTRKGPGQITCTDSGLWSDTALTTCNIVGKLVALHIFCPTETDEL